MEEPPALAALGKLSQVNAALWIAARLADGLAHAHERGILHCDLKPANVLIADDGQPMLLDFNVAADRIGGGRTVNGECGPADGLPFGAVVFSKIFDVTRSNRAWAVFDASSTRSPSRSI